MTDVDTKPRLVSQTVREDIAWGIDVSAQLTEGQTVTAPAATLTGPAGPVTLVDAVGVDGKIIRQRVRPGLAPGLYELVVGFTPSGTTNFLESTLKIRVPG